MTASRTAWADVVRPAPERRFGGSAGHRSSWRCGRDQAVADAAGALPVPQPPPAGDRASAAELAGGPATARRPRQAPRGRRDKGVGGRRHGRGSCVEQSQQQQAVKGRKHAVGTAGPGGLLTRKRSPHRASRSSTYGERGWPRTVVDEAFVRTPNFALARTRLRLSPGDRSAACSACSRLCAVSRRRGESQRRNEQGTT